VVSPRYLLDTTVLSEGAKPRPNQRVMTRVHANDGETAIAAPSFHEFLYGIQRLPVSRRRAQLERYFSAYIARAVMILPYDAKAAEWHAAERARLVALGRTPPFVDGQIAAVAATQGLILVTFNVRDFQAFEGLQTEDWRE
jgi:tRNA(fMet)-specific endonuclease VapC